MHDGERHGPSRITGERHLGRGRTTRDHDATEHAQPTHVGPPKDHAVGLPATVSIAKQTMRHLGVARTASTLTKINHPGGFDCPGCAWPEPEAGPHHLEFCENGAKAVAEEATLRRIGRSFFARHSVADLRERSGYWLGQQGRLTEPMHLAPGATHYAPISWDDAFALIARELRALDSPDEAAFYTSGRTSNEAAFAYGLLARALGTNNLPDCSNMCHESTSVALAETIGIGKGSVTINDLVQADLIVVAGQNPGTNHPRMLTTLEEAKQRGAKILTVNPLPEAGLGRFDNPQKLSGLAGHGTELTDLFLQVRLGGDQALFRAFNHLLLRDDDAAGASLDTDTGTTAAAAAATSAPLDHAFLAAHTEGLPALRDDLAELDWDAVLTATGLTREEIDEAYALLRASERTVVCWAMGITQHRDAVATIQEIVNTLLLRGMIGKPGAGLCPVRGHSNVQGDRTMGIWEQPPPAFLDALQDEFAFSPPREHGLDVVDTIHALADGRVKVFMAMGGNFISATPDTPATEAAMAKTRLTVQVSTKLNRSHVVTGREALILPTLGRTDRDADRFVTVEDSMSVVHASRGHLAPPSGELRSEVEIVCGLAERLFAGDHAVGRIPWAAMGRDYAVIREQIAAVVPGFQDFERRVAWPGGFVLPHPPRDSRTFTTDSGKAHLTVNPLEPLTVPPGHLLLQTLRSHDQYNTTIYGMDDRYRGITGGRRVVFVRPSDLDALGLQDGELVDLVADTFDGTPRRADGFRVVAYPTARGCAAAYYPETNPLVPLRSVARRSNTPTSKSIVVRLVPTAAV